MKPQQKILSEMPLEKLWQLFPIRLTGHQEYWAEWYKEEEELLRQRLPDIRRINHIGSTAVEGILAKPTVDILAEMPKDARLTDFKDAVENCGYICMTESGDRIDFNKGYTLQGFAERVFHLHLRHIGDNDELYFRDFLTDNPAVAKEYERLKLDLWRRYEHDRDAYTHGKSDFIKHYTQKAKLLFADRYRQ